MKFLRVFKCPHSWRRLTSEHDYGNGFSKHWGNYHGVMEEECRFCGLLRRVQGWQEWRYEMDDAEKKVDYLKSIEPEN